MIFTDRLYDSLHGFIHLTSIERQLLEQLPFVRLHYLHQLGITYLVYPGATHTRYEHSLGVMHLASLVYDRLFETENLLYKQALRIGALCHDIGHLPFSHAAEELLLGKKGHEMKTHEILHAEDLSPIFEEVEKKQPGFLKLVLKIALSPEVYVHFYPGETYSEIEWMLSQIVSGDYFGVDRIDYLLRDSRFTGVSHGLFDYPQLLEMLELGSFKNKPAIVLKEEGLAAAEGLLLARHYMQDRVYHHPSVLVYNRALAAFMKEFFVKSFVTLSPRQYLQISDADVASAFFKAAIDPHSLGHKEALILTKKTSRKSLEEVLDKGGCSGAKLKSLLVKKRGGEVVDMVPKNDCIRLFEEREG